MSYVIRKLSRKIKAIFSSLAGLNMREVYHKPMYRGIVIGLYFVNIVTALSRVEPFLDAMSIVFLFEHFS